MYSISRSSSEILSTRSSEEKRCSVCEPVRRLRILTCTKPRRLPGVRCVMVKIEYNSLLKLITMPGRNCVAEIIESYSIPRDSGRRIRAAREAETISVTNSADGAPARLYKGRWYHESY